MGWQSVRRNLLRTNYIKSLPGHMESEGLLPFNFHEGVTKLLQSSGARNHKVSP